MQHEHRDRAKEQVDNDDGHKHFSQQMPANDGRAGEH
jgi:hypothetical protein